MVDIIKKLYSSLGYNFAQVDAKIKELQSQGKTQEEIDGLVAETMQSFGQNVIVDLDARDDGAGFGGGGGAGNHPYKGYGGGGGGYSGGGGASWNGGSGPAGGGSTYVPGGFTSTTAGSNSGAGSVEVTVL